MCDSYGCKRTASFRIVLEGRKERNFCFSCFCEFFNKTKEKDWKLKEVRYNPSKKEIEIGQKRLVDFL